MSRRVKEIVDVGDHLSIDDLIEKLKEIREGLPQEAEAELRLRGDEVFGHRITISYFRDQTAEEVELEQRYDEASRDAKEKELARLQAELGVVCYAAPGKRGKLRIVAGAVRRAESSAPARSCNNAGRLASDHRRTRARDGRRSVRTAPRCAPASSYDRRA